MERNRKIDPAFMLKLKTYYLVKLAEDEHKKPRFYESDEQIEYGDRVVCHQKNGDKVGYCVGHLTCSKETMKKLINQVGTYPLVKCEIYKEKEKDIFVMMGICEKGERPIDLINKLINEIVMKDEKYQTTQNKELENGNK